MTRTRKLTIIGNCQAKSIAELIPAMCSGVETNYVQLSPATMGKLLSGSLGLSTVTKSGSDITALVSSSDRILLQSGRPVGDYLEECFPDAISRFLVFPPVSFNGFHPDMIHISNQMVSATGPYHSSIACYGWLCGLSVTETANLFRQEVFDALGFSDYWDISRESLLDKGKAAGLPLDHLFDSWCGNGIWMHTINHPKLFVLADLAREVLVRGGIPFQPDVERRVADRLANSFTWMVYPEIAAQLGVDGRYQFKPSGRRDAPTRALDLEEFIDASFKSYANYRKEDFDCPRLASPPYQELHKFVRRLPHARTVISGGPVSVRKSKAKTAVPVSHNPYQNLQDYQFWRRAIERPRLQDVDPVVRGRFKLTQKDKVATAGSCFAQHISRTLQKNGFTYFISETGDRLSVEEAQQRNFGVFSARYGNLYTTRQLVQLFDRAFGRFTPEDSCWLREDGRFVDPFRPQIEPEGFATIEALEQSRAAHLMAVRQMFKTLDVFVFTLGLTESWRSRVDGAVFPLAPGVVAGSMDPTLHEFVNFGVSDVVADLRQFIRKLGRVNPQARVILTVSPVPLIATYEDRHVLVSTTYSKSVLRVAAEEIARSNAHCDYFPSYEIITGNYTKGEYYESDLRSVKTVGVEHVMRLFMKHYAAEQATDSLADRLMQENEELAEVVCDEEAIDAAD